MSEESKEVEKFNPQDLMQGVKDKIKATFVSLIPDDQWEQMVETEVNKFFKVRQDSYISNNNHDKYHSDFGDLVKQILNEETKEKVREILQGDKYKSDWKDGRTVASKHLDQLIKKAMPDMFMTIMTNTVSNTIQQMQNNVPQQY